MCLHERVVAELRMTRDHTIDLRGLAGGETLVLIEAPDTRHQSLPSQYVVNPGDAAGERVSHVEDRGVGIGERGTRSEQLGAHGARCGLEACTPEQLRGA